MWATGSHTSLVNETDIANSVTSAERALTSNHSLTSVKNVTSPYNDTEAVNGYEFANLSLIVAKPKVAKPEAMNRVPSSPTTNYDVIGVDEEIDVNATSSDYDDAIPASGDNDAPSSGNGSGDIAARGRSQLHNDTMLVMTSSGDVRVQRHPSTVDADDLSSTNQSLVNNNGGGGGGGKLMLSDDEVSVNDSLRWSNHVTSNDTGYDVSENMTSNLGRDRVLNTTEISDKTDDVKVVRSTQRVKGHVTPPPTNRPNTHKMTVDQSNVIEFGRPGKGMKVTEFGIIGYYNRNYNGNKSGTDSSRI